VGRWGESGVGRGPEAEAAIVLEGWCFRSVLMENI